jgi:CHAT domain-containing protein
VSGKDDETVNEAKTQVQSIGDFPTEMLFIWENAVKPALEELNLLEEKKGLQSPLPRVWWIGVGLMTKIPFHAAGDHSPESTENTLSHVVSSYATTLKSLQYARSKNRKLTIPQSHRILVVTMAKTPGYSGILEVEREVTAIEEAAGTVQSTMKVLRQPSKDSVLREFPDYTICHFACHAKADPREPGKSALCLGKDRLEELSVADLDTVKHLNAQIAYLSACSTVESKVFDLLDENIHLANTFLIAGFPHVVGTLWKANDSAAIEVAREFYKCLLKGNGAEDESVSFALHKAVLALRNSGDNIGDIWKWAPFVHLGA